MRQTYPAGQPATRPTCPECGRSFDLYDPTDAAEWTFGHDCEPTAGHPAPELCPDCGHATDGHDRRAEDGRCELCEDRAQVGQYAPCAGTDRRPCPHEPNEPGTACRLCGLPAEPSDPDELAEELAEAVALYLDTRATAPAPADMTAERRAAATIAYKHRVNAAWSAADPRRRSPRVPFPEVIANRADLS